MPVQMPGEVGGTDVCAGTPQGTSVIAEVTAASVRSCRDRLAGFIARYLPLFSRKEQEQHALVVVQGRLSNLRRKTSEPIAYLAGQERKPVQNFVGCCGAGYGTARSLRRDPRWVR